MMKELGYAYEYFEKANLKAGSAIFFRDDKFACSEPEQHTFSPN